MDWAQHKQLAESSREIIVIPFFIKALRSVDGPCLDIGCGTADLTNLLAKTTGVSITGIDRSILDIPINENVHLIKADITKNGILETSLTFNSAYSNCCFCHLTDDELVVVLVDLFNSMAQGGKFVFLVPSKSWAEKLYRDIHQTPSGISAIPRSGGRQYFRTADWYKSALRRAGFINICHKEIIIPQNKNLDSRYLEKAGQSIFSSFSCARGNAIPDKSQAKKAFEIAHDNRKLEIQLFWQRSLFFWGFVAAALVAYAQTIEKSPEISTLIALFGFVCSIIWSRGNRGSKYWQEYWEKKVNFYQHFSTGNIFFDRKPTEPKILEIYEGRRSSVSKLTMALSDFSIAIWAALCIGTLLDKSIIAKHWHYLSLGFIILTLFYCLIFLRMSKSED